MRRRRAFLGQEWAMRDLNVIALFLALVLLGERWPVLFLVALVLALVLLGVAAVRIARHRLIARQNDGKPSWLDEIRRPSDS